MTAKHLVACELLERSIELYLRGDSFYAALHLGGAAEEILAVYARGTPATAGRNLVPPFDQMKDLVVALSDAEGEFERRKVEKWVYDRMTDPKNSVKHKRGRGDSHVEFDPIDEAYDVIDRAISTYFQLMSALHLPHISSVADFDAARRGRER